MALRLARARSNSGATDGSICHAVTPPWTKPYAPAKEEEPRIALQGHG